MDDKVIGVVGLGLLGSALAGRLSAAGFSVIGHDLRPEANAAVAVSSADAVRQRRVVLSLPDSAAVEAVLADAVAGQRVIDTTTGDPARTAALGQALARRGVSYVDATVLGSSEQARAGDVLVMAGGDADAVAEAADVFAAFARRWSHVGPVGSGASMKLVVNLALGLNRAVLAEALSFAGRCGLDRRAALEILRDGAAYSRVMDVKGEKMLSGDFSPQAKLSQHLKDVRLILEAAARAAASVPLSQAHAALLERVVESGGGDDDNSAVVRAYDP